MRAVIYEKYGAPEVLQLKTVEAPTPQAGEVLIKIQATAVSSEDCTFRKGSPFIARSATGFNKPKHPILGTEFSGEVESVGEGVTKFKPGDNVFGATGDSFGAYAEYIALPEDGSLAPKPASLSYEEAVAVCGGFLTALPFLRDAGKLQSDQAILINGASGSVGAAAIQLGKHFGAEVTGVCSTANVELVKSLGADHVVDYKTEDFTQGNARYDIVFDAVGKSSFSLAKKVLKEHGFYLRTVLDLPIVLQMMWTSAFGRKKAKIIFSGLRPASEKAKDLGFLTTLVEADDYQPVIDRCYPLDQIVEAHRYVEKGHKTGSVIITVANNIS